VGKLVPSEKFKIVIEYAPLISIDIIVKYKEKILLGKRVNKPAFGYYFTTGGIIRKNESFQEAQVRIVQDELGIELEQDLILIGIFEHFYEDGIFDNISTHYVNHGYLLELNKELKSLPNEQHSEYKWFTIDEVMKSDQVHKYVKDYFKK
jgi:colanic acid biosynthesis protein WcaH